MNLSHHAEVATVLLHGVTMDAEPAWPFRPSPRLGSPLLAAGPQT